MYRHLLPHSGNNLRNGFRNGRLANIAGSNGLPLLSATEAGKVTNKTKTDICLEMFEYVHPIWSPLTPRIRDHLT